MPYRDLIQSVGIEEISHLELITKTISQLLDGSPRYQGDKFKTPGAGFAGAVIAERLATQDGKKGADSR